jgi:phosphatidate cytidylyltransferase
LIVAMIMQGAVEWSLLSGYSNTQRNFYLVLCLLLMLLLLWANIDTNSLYHYQLPIYAIAAFLWFVVVPVWLFTGLKVRNSVIMALTGWAVLIPTGLAMMDLRAYSPWVLLFVMSLVWVADIAAYFTGRKFGKHKLAPSISPGKTWEGVAGAVLGVTLYTVLVWLVKPMGMLTIILPAACLLVALAVMGDLFESAIKRQAGVKDSGALLPGHGGLLDRIDALTSTLPLAAMAMLLIKLGYF